MSKNKTVVRSPAYCFNSNLQPMDGRTKVFNLNFGQQTIDATIMNRSSVGFLFLFFFFFPPPPPQFSSLHASDSSRQNASIKRSCTHHCCSFLHECPVLQQIKPQINRAILAYALYLAPSSFTSITNHLPADNSLIMMSSELNFNP